MQGCSSRDVCSVYFLTRVRLLLPQIRHSILFYLFVNQFSITPLRWQTRQIAVSHQTSELLHTAYMIRLPFVPCHTRQYPSFTATGFIISLSFTRAIVPMTVRRLLCVEQKQEIKKKNDEKSHIIEKSLIVFFFYFFCCCCCCLLLCLFVAVDCSFWVHTRE